MPLLSRVSLVVVLLSAASVWADMALAQSITCDVDASDPNQTKYVYDELGRLVQVCYEYEQTKNYAFDPEGNRTSVVVTDAIGAPNPGVGGAEYLYIPLNGSMIAIPMETAGS